MAIGFVLLSACTACSDKAVNQPSKSREEVLADLQRRAAEQKRQAEERFAAMSAGDHLTTAQEDLTKNSGTLHFREAERHLSAIPENAPEAIKAKELYAEIAKLRRSAEQKQKAKAKAEAVRLEEELEVKRMLTARQIDDYFLKNGIESRTVARGHGYRELVIHDVLAGRVRARAITEGDLMPMLKLLGFYKLTYTDDYETTFTWDLTK
ncbi:MAG: hypothetical protein AB7O65_00700 [Candidatus Korobacteraceae bacterium]